MFVSSQLESFWRLSFLHIEEIQHNSWYIYIFINANKFAYIRTEI